MPDATKSLKVLERIVAGDIIEFELGGVPADILYPRITLHFLRFSFTQDLNLATSSPIILPGVLQNGNEDRRAVHVTFANEHPPGMYLLSGLSFRALLLDGRYAMGTVGNPAVPMEPFLGFCVGRDLCDVKLLDEQFRFVHLNIL